MPIENEIQDFRQLYRNYSRLKNDIDDRIIGLPKGNDQETLMQFNIEVEKFDVKLRLGLAIREIYLNNMFAIEKQGDLKSCHLMLYKLADIWFSYESYIRLYSFNSSSKNKITWLSTNAHQHYINNGHIQSALTVANQELVNFFDNHEKRRSLKDYLIYCSDEAKGSQKRRLNAIHQAINPTQDLGNYNHTQILSMTYSIRNNFVHNGEVTIHPNSFNYSLKNEYLKILYKYLVIITISAATITIQRKLAV